MFTWKEWAGIIFIFVMLVIISNPSLVDWIWQ